MCHLTVNSISIHFTLSRTSFNLLLQFCSWFVECKKWQIEYWWIAILHSDLCPYYRIILHGFVSFAKSVLKVSPIFSICLQQRLSWSARPQSSSNQTSAKSRSAHFGCHNNRPWKGKLQRPSYVPVVAYRPWTRDLFPRASVSAWRKRRGLRPWNLFDSEIRMGPSPQGLIWLDRSW